MARDRKRERRGHHASVGGDPADEALGDLVAQFSDPYAFIRELIQNSLDAGAARIDVRMAWDDHRLTVDVMDDGEGMDRATIEGYLLTLFRSTKEDDLTKIGKFGIGFVSLFAMGPQQVIVDTARDGVWHRVQFAEDRSFTLLEMPEPREGTTVRLELARSQRDARTDCERIRASAVRWCRFAEAEITTSASGLGQGGWDEAPIAAPFTVEAPVVVTHRSDGFEAALGPSRAPSAGFYNLGLTLFESDGPALIDGVSFRVKGRHLEHTLTRDNVRRDRHFDEAMRRLRALAAEELGRAVQDALAEADLPRAHEIFAAVAPDHAWTWDRSAPLFPRIGGPHASLADLGRPSGWLRNLWGAPERPLLWSIPDDPVALAVAEAGHLVLAARSAADAHLLYAAALIGASPAPVRERFRAPRPVPPQPARDARIAAAVAASRALDLSWTLHPAAELGGAFAVAQHEPYAVEEIRRGGIASGSHLMVAAHHRVWDAMTPLAPAVAGPMVLRAALVGAGVAHGPVDRALVDLVRSALAREPMGVRA
jgi:molecular chaperone HtpG